eukprot:Partr_v1_DN27155_c1_g1_i2_m16206 putative protein kinase kinase kinase
MNFARFQYILDVKPRFVQPAHRKIDFNFGADDLFAVSIDDGLPLVASPRDATNYYFNYFRSTSTRFSLYMLPGSYRLKFSVANYLVTGSAVNAIHLRGAISTEGSIIDVTSSSSGKWTDSLGNNVIECGQPGAALLAEVENPFSNTGIASISIGACNKPDGIYDFYYLLDVAEPSLSNSPALISRTLSSGSGKQSLVNPIDSHDNDSMKIAGLFVSRLVLYALCVGAAMFVSCISIFFWQRKRSKKATALLATTTSKISSSEADAYSLSSETTETSTTQRTAVATDFASVLSIPAYLQVVEGPDYRVEKKLIKNGADIIMTGTAFNPKLSMYGHQIVVKKVSATPMTELEKAAFYQEISITSYLQHCPNIVRILGYSESPPSIILKLYPFGSLRSWLKVNAQNRPKSLMFSFLKDISCGLLSLHQAGLIHCDVKSDNALVDQNSGSGKLYCVLCDFGITQVSDSKILQVQAFVVANRQGFSLMYAAPEVFAAFRGRMSRRSYASDMYAYAIVGVELLNGGKMAL